MQLYSSKILNHICVYKYIKKASLMSQLIKNLPASTRDAGDAHSISGSGKIPKTGNGSLLQYFCLGNSRDCRAWWATAHGITKSQTQLIN